MIINELQHIVLLEFLCLVSIILIIISAFKRWKKILCGSIFFASIAFFVAWSHIMAIGAFMVYGSSCVLLWIQQGTKEHRLQKNIQKTQIISWGILAAGVMFIILNNVYYIYLHLNSNQTIM